MANYNLLGINTSTPQAVAPTASDTGVVSNLTVTTNLTATAGTANGIVYLNGSKVQTSGAGLQFDGANAGIGVTPSAWNSLYRSMDIGDAAFLAGRTDNNRIYIGSNYFVNSGGATVYKASDFATYYSQQDGKHVWLKAASGIAGNTATFTTVKTIDTSGHWLPGADNTQNVGSGALRMAVIYAGTGTINTSDAREKEPLRALTANEILAAKALGKEIGAYVFLSARAEKGDSAREHIGMTVQRAIEVMESFSLNPFGYGFICYDEWDEVTEEVVSENGSLSRQVQRQATETVIEPKIEIVDGVPVYSEAEVQKPVFEKVNVVGPNGESVTFNDEPLMHDVPVMETVTEKYDVVVKLEAGNRYSFRTDELALFILAGLSA